MFWLLLGALLYADEKEAILIGADGKVRKIDQEPPKKVAPKKRISLDLEEADIHSVIRFFGQVTGRNFIVSDEVKGTVTVRLNDVPWDQALNAILLSKGLMAQDMGQVIVVGN